MTIGFSFSQYQIPHKLKQTNLFLAGPGSTKPALIPKSQLKYLSFVVQGNGRTRQKYSYWNAKNIAKDPRINFKRLVFSTVIFFNFSKVQFVKNFQTITCAQIFQFISQLHIDQWFMPKKYVCTYSRKTLLVAIGYLDSPNLPISAMFANEYEERGYNVILVDYQRFATVHYHL